MTANEGCYKALFFDLFGTLVFFDSSRIPFASEELKPALRTARYLAPRLRREFPGLGIDDFADGLEKATAELRQEAGEELYEHPSEERFRRALLRSGWTGLVPDGPVERLVAEHMRVLTNATFLPDGYRQILSQLAERYQLALVSNFDHAQTARAILQRESIGELFQRVLISVDVGRRKPHPLIFRKALEAFGIEAHDAIHIGDSLQADIHGAHSVGIATAWINSQVDQTDSEKAADHIIPDIARLKDFLL